MTQGFRGWKGMAGGDAERWHQLQRSAAGAADRRADEDGEEGAAVRLRTAGPPSPRKGRTTSSSGPTALATPPTRPPPPPPCSRYVSVADPRLCRVLIHREKLLQALPCALVAGFVKTDKEIPRERMRERVTTSGGELGRLNIVNGAEIAPLRRWPGDLCLSRSTGGDVDAEEFIISVPHLSDAGGKLIIASDGIWDASAANCCRGSPAELAARRDGHLNLSFLRSVEPAWFLAPSESESAHAASIFSAGSKPWQGAVAPSSLFLHKHPHRFRIFLLGCCHYFSMGCMIISLYLHLH
ncbi:PP2Cc [Musa troglodytarum]|uniref:protein-serine/threonine phosphatase n=1 Tax=Musa troglodytarum TaxID=320322 RepID=A0A9E7KZM0_9LILI|nr:PP2Cc [Musa troglodytarum]